MTFSCPQWVLAIPIGFSAYSLVICGYLKWQTQPQFLIRVSAQLHIVTITKALDRTLC